MVIFSVCAAFTIEGLYSTITDILGYPHITTTDITFQSKVDFPGVTVCNLNRVNCHNAFMASYNLSQMLESQSISNEQKVVVSERNLHVQYVYFRQQSNAH